MLGLLPLRRGGAQNAGGTHGDRGEQKRRGSPEAEEAVGAFPGEQGESPEELLGEQREGGPGPGRAAAAACPAAGSAAGAGDELVPAGL